MEKLAQMLLGRSVQSALKNFWTIFWRWVIVTKHLSHKQNDSINTIFLSYPYNKNFSKNNLFLILRIIANWTHYWQG